MKEETFNFSYSVYTSADELPTEDKALLQRARESTTDSYAPYSNFHVAAAALLQNGKVICGTNQENASFPAGLCAERVLLSSTSSVYPGVAIKSMAISYSSHAHKSDHPISPCGICRQSLQEFESRMQQPVKLILAGMEGPVYVINGASKLLPLAFTSSELA